MGSLILVRTGKLHAGLRARSAASWCTVPRVRAEEGEARLFGWPRVVGGSRGGAFDLVAAVGV